jgi:hypothetical protein
VTSAICSVRVAKRLRTWSNETKDAPARKAFAMAGRLTVAPAFVIWNRYGGGFRRALWYAGTPPVNLDCRIRLL